MVCSICRQAGHNRRTCPHNNVTLRTPTQHSIMQNINDDMIDILETDDLIIQALGEEEFNDLSGFQWGDEEEEEELESTIEAHHEEDYNSMPELIAVEDEEEEKEEEQNEKVYKSETCCICLENIKKTNTCTTKCGHQFCLTCLFDNINSSKDGKLDCPMCRKKVYQMDIKHSQIQRYGRMNTLINEAVQREFMLKFLNITSNFIDMFDFDGEHGIASRNCANQLRNLLSTNNNFKQQFEYNLKLLIIEITSVNNERVNDIITDSAFSTIFDTVL